MAVGLRAFHIIVGVLVVHVVDVQMAVGALAACRCRCE